jgi:hypothetical protein
MDLTVNCEVYNAKLTEGGCLLNRQKAEATAKLLKGSSPGMCLLIDELDLDRLAGCSQCERCAVCGEEDIYINALTRDITIIVDQVLNENANHDPEEQKAKELAKYARYNKKCVNRTSKSRGL